ncbi:MAG: hypothetical protein AAFN27_16040 [Pseudomonadota bacterium]
MSIEHQETTSNGGDNHLVNVNAIDVLRVDDQVYAIVGGQDDRLHVYTIEMDATSSNYGQMSDTPVDTVVDAGSFNLSNLNAIESLEVGGTTYVFAGGTDNGISSFSIDGAGQLTHADDATDSSAINITQVYGLSTASIDDGAGGLNHFVFAVSDGAGENEDDDDGISVFQVASDGTMTNVDNVIDAGSLEINNPRDVETVQVDDGAGGVNTFVVVGGNDDGLSVFSVASNGTLTNTDNVSDSGALELSNVQAVEGFSIDGTSYVVAGGDDDGVSFFEVDTSGNLTSVGNVDDDGTLNLRNIDDLFVGDYQGEQVLWVAGNDGGLDAFEILSTAEPANSA